MSDENKRPCPQGALPPSSGTSAALPAALRASLSAGEEKSEQPRRYGLFGVSATGGMSENQRKSMARWATAFVVVMAAAFLFLVVSGSTGAAGLTVTFDSQGGSAAASQSVLYGDTAEEPEDVVRVGYTLVGWSLTPDGEQLWDFSSDAVEENTTLYAVWETQ